MVTRRSTSGAGADLHRLTVYDATYLELALRLSLPLATFDDDLRRAAQQEGVSLLVFFQEGRLLECGKSEYSTTDSRPIALFVVLRGKKPS
jgi:hypothetical protein